jgi:hypothetical protein
MPKLLDVTFARLPSGEPRPVIPGPSDINHIPAGRPIDFALDDPPSSGLNPARLGLARKGRAAVRPALRATDAG